MIGCKSVHKIIIGDSRKMQEVSDKSIHLIITSPPYWQLKDYGSGNQIGYNDTYEDYINNLNLVWKECYRVLHDGCRLCINIGDQFARSVYYGRYKVIPIRTEIIKFCETIGFDYMGAIIWQKPTTMNTTGGATVMGSFPYPRNGIVKIDYEFILLFKKPGNPPDVSPEIKESSKLTKEQWDEYFSGHWHFKGERQKGHLAMFPEELPHRLIRMFSFVGETVLDPFLGSGTTSLAAKNLSRNSIGYEINKDFLPIIMDKLNINKSSLWDNEQFEIIEQRLEGINFDEEIKKLPYVFVDKVSFDKKVDPKMLQFGSKIGLDDAQSPIQYYSVKEFLSPEELLLNNGLKIRLIGIRAIPEKTNEALEFLKRKLKGQRVYLKFDKEKYDSENNLLVYLYMENKTFINMHLLKNGLAQVDTDMSFTHREKFLKTQKEALCQKNGY